MRHRAYLTIRPPLLRRACIVGFAAQGLLVPTLIEIDQSRQGNPLAAYARILELEPQYHASPTFRDIYDQVRLMQEEFLGVPDAGLRAMNVIAQLHQTYPPGEVPIPPGYAPQSAMRVIEHEAARTRIVIWGEEHHLPQTRSLYETMLRRLWGLGYRYLAAETFADSVMSPGFRVPDFGSGVYLRDPVYATAIRVAVGLGYRLIGYEETAIAPAGDASFRDRRQAERLKERVFDTDSTAKVLVLAGRGHASEQTASDGWTPMASVLKRLTGIDPFTIFAVRMGERLTSEEEDPRYRFATSHGLVKRPTIFADPATGRILGDDSFDAFVFWPRTRIIGGRPDWLETVLGRARVAIPTTLTVGSGLRLVQAFRSGENATVIPVDQVLVDDQHPPSDLMLPVGRYWLRAIDRSGKVLATAAAGHGRQQVRRGQSRAVRELLPFSSRGAGKTRRW